MRTKFYLTACLALTLAACETPNYFPDGYTHHAKPYKNQDPAPSPKFTQEMRATMGPEQADQFRLAVYALVERLTARAGLPPKPVFVVTPERITPLHAIIENNLRESLRHMGYTLADTADGAYPFAYSSVVIKDAEGKPLPDDGVSPNVRISPLVYDRMGEGSRLLTQEVGDFYIKGAPALNIPSINFPGLAAPDMHDRTGAFSQ
jgi:hypothetical protein